MQSSLLRFRAVDLLCPTEREVRQSLNDFSSGLNAVVHQLLQVTQAKQDAHTIEMWDIDAREAVNNDPDRYSLSKPKNFGAPLVAQPRPAVRPAPAPARPAPANDPDKTT